MVVWAGSVALGFEKFRWQTIPGFLVLIFGTLLYNEIIVLPFWGFDQWTKVAVESRQEKSKREATEVANSIPL